MGVGTCRGRLLRRASEMLLGRAALGQEVQGIQIVLGSSPGQGAAGEERDVLRRVVAPVRLDQSWLAPSDVMGSDDRNPPRLKRCRVR